MSGYRLLAIDIDGTLVDIDDRISPAVHAALQRAAASGVRLVLVTGRRYGRILHLVEPLAINAPLVTASGSLIKDPATHETLFCSRIERDLLREVLATVGKRGYEALLYGDTHAEGFEYYCPRNRVEDPLLAEFLEINAGCERVWPALMHDPPGDVFSGFAMGERGAMLELDALLQERFPGLLYTHVLRSPRYTGFMCEIAMAGVTKWSGVLHLADAWGIGPEQICAVGDDVNDVPMIEGAGLGVAMGNAPDEVKRAADRVAPANYEDGLVRVVEWVLGETTREGR